ncbi:fused MFS/spermidine synthase [Hydrogenovibrio sp. 3SP14C1]|uniref:spermidine synthase n=1 Tax=Hydrogenovibrio sp. 3SP14C1 TaxID=3038774 RepID=UPI002415C594|nr:fused MFS/spermidine synthase [Hydrogenovibrio sp. 3SP14C1]MDG4812328.1 fused MFS/spermidine synthase [Hydrogenovibrio sp. 3SP14C1]
MAKHPNGSITYSARDEFGLIQVVDNDITRSLYFDSLVEQSRYYFNAPLTLAFEYQACLLEDALEKAHSSRVQSILMLGLGGGSLASQLHSVLPNCQQTLVELREAVIQIAYRYFYLPETPQIETIQADAQAFVQHSPQQYNLIIVDLYDNESMPWAFTEEAFLSQLLSLVSPSGRILFNLWKSSPEKTLAVLEFWDQCSYANIKTREIQSSGNIILCVDMVKR